MVDGMGQIKNFLMEIKTNNTKDDILIILLAASLFLPYFITITYLIVLAIFIVWKRDLKKIISNTKAGFLILIVAGYMCLTSLIFQNYLGVLISVGLFFAFITFLYYKYYITKEIFEKMISVMIFLSLIAGVYAIFEQLYYIYTLDTLDNIVSFFEIANSPKYRVHTFFMNANYYAMMIVFVILFCFYRFLSQNKNHPYYLLVALFNGFALFLTGSRFAWLCLVLALIVTFALSKKTLAFFGTLSATIIIYVLTFFNVPIIPRFVEYGFSLGRRQTIYETASLMVKDTWLFGKGPLTYLNEYPKYLNEYIAKFGDAHLTKLGISSQHTHSLFIEPFISFGLIGSLIFIIFLFYQYRDAFRLFKAKVDQQLLILMISATAVVLMADVFDLPILWIQTGFLFFLIIGATSIYTNKNR